MRSRVTAGRPSVFRSSSPSHSSCHSPKQSVIYLTSLPTVWHSLPRQDPNYHAFSPVIWSLRTIALIMNHSSVWLGGSLVYPNLQPTHPSVRMGETFHFNAPADRDALCPLHIDCVLDRAALHAIACHASACTRTVASSTTCSVICGIEEESRQL